MPWGAAAGAAVSIAGGLLGGSGQSDKITQGQKQALAAEKQNWQQTTGFNMPYANDGVLANETLANLNGLNGSAAQSAAAGGFTQDPGYKFDLQQGQTAVDNSAAARGLGTSGADIKGSAEFATGLADQSYGSYINRLTSLAGQGQTAIGQDASAGAGAASGAAQTDAGAAQDQANIAGSTTSGVSNALTGFLNNQTVQNALTSYMSPSSGGTGWGTNGGGNALSIPNDGF